MPQPTATLLYVSSIPKSTKFYSELLGLKPSMASPFYVMYKLDNGFEIQIYDRAKLDPPAEALAGAAELGFVVADVAALDALHADWMAQGISIIMRPTKMYFGGTHFMGVDPDGHRLRVGTPD